VTDIEAQVRRAYAGRAAEYTRLLGDIADMDERDRDCISRWALRIDGPVIDAGCGPGHWTDFLSQRGVDICGIDLVPEFIEIARSRFPAVPFRTSSFHTLALQDESLSGVLAWYSLIHLQPTELPAALAEFRRVLRPDGHFLVGFFEGPAAEPFQHAVTDAFYWSVPQMRVLLENAGFKVLDTEMRRDEGGRRPHAAMTATAH